MKALISAVVVVVEDVVVVMVLATMVLALVAGETDATACVACFEVTIFTEAACCSSFCTSIFSLISGRLSLEEMVFFRNASFG